jgi:uncharacterized protein
VRVGVVTDTHVGEHLPELPPEVEEALAGVDLVIHAGDLVLPGVQRRLEALAPVVAVRGNHDDEAGRADLPREVLVRIAGRRIGVTHGTRSRALEGAGGVLSLARGRPSMLGFERALRRRFDAVDVVVCGHVHMPVHRVVGGALVFSPGAVYIPECDPWFDWATLRGRAYRRFRQLTGPAARVPAVGVLELPPRGGVRARRIPLTEPLRAGTRAEAG